MKCPLCEGKKAGETKIMTRRFKRGSRVKCGERRQGRFTHYQKVKVQWTCKKCGTTA